LARSIHVPSFTIATDIPAAPELVFNRIADVKRAGDWQIIHQGFAAEPPAEIAPGTTFTQKVKMLGMPADVAWTVTRFDSPTTIELAGAGPMGVTMRSLFSVAAANGGSHVTVENELGGGPLTGPLGDSVAKESQAAQEASLEKLKSLVAAEA
jgi:polyketide cyclase/dehydrase/lipid transport protein